MSDRREIRYMYDGGDEYRELETTVHEIIKNDTGSEQWPETKSFPPLGIPPAMTSDGIEKLKALKGVKVMED